MFLKRVQVVIAITLVFSLSYGQTCAALSPDVWKSSCPKSQAADRSTGPIDEKPCKVFPCQSRNGRVFMLPDTPAFRIERESQGRFNQPVAHQIVFAPGGLFSLSLKPDIHLLEFLQTAVSPKFILNCAFLR